MTYTPGNTRRSTLNYRGDLSLLISAGVLFSYVRESGSARTRGRWVPVGLSAKPKTLIRFRSEPRKRRNRGALIMACLFRRRRTRRICLRRRADRSIDTATDRRRRISDSQSYGDVCCVAVELFRCRHHVTSASGARDEPGPCPDRRGHCHGSRYSIYVPPAPFLSASFFPASPAARLCTAGGGGVGCQRRLILYRGLYLIFLCFHVG